MIKITTTLSERPYAKHNFKAAVIMRETMILGSMLNTAESWINIAAKDFETLKKIDTIREIFFQLVETLVKISCALSWDLFL